MSLPKSSLAFFSVCSLASPSNPRFPAFLVPLFPLFRSASSVATGLLGMMGNKGGVGIRFEVNNSSLCFICCHLAAHREKVSARNADYHKLKIGGSHTIRILSEMVFSAPLAASSSSSPSSSASSQTIVESAESISILSHDVVYWVSPLFSLFLSAR